MKADAVSILHLLNGLKQFTVPIYQRTYSWTPKQCEQLWDDIIRAGQNPDIPGHFVGSIVYIHDGVPLASGIQAFQVIDGQQRLTTLALLLAALARAARSAPNTGVNADLIQDEYLTNHYGEGPRHYKLLLTQSDRDTLISVIEGWPLPPQTSQPVIENFEFFQRKVASGANLATIYEGIGKLLVVQISLDRTQDNPQLIFESLNSTGMDLSQADLIRNYILMGLPGDEQAHLYSQFWYPMEQLFGANYGADFDYFMRDYLTVASGAGSIPNIGKVYERFKTYRVDKHSASITDLVRDVYDHAVYYTRLAYQMDPDPEVNAIMRDINTLEADVTYPFLLEMYADYARERLSRSDMLALLRLVESYVFRRAICDIPTNSMNKTFATLMGSVDKSHYRQSVEALLLGKTSYRRFPDDDEFRRMFVSRNIYDLTRRRAYLLAKLENHHHAKEPITVKSYTIEHIMPQTPNLPASWKAMLGPNWQQVQSTYLHTIGNLTLTGYNPELSDHPFLEKRDMAGGFASSPLALNADLATAEAWNEQAIIARARRLADLALQIWARPQLAQAPASAAVIADEDEEDEEAASA